VVLGTASEYHDPSYYKLVNIAYGNENASFEVMNVNIVYSDGSLSISASRSLPNGITSGMSTLNVANDVLVYKDSREKLTFTIKVSGYEI
jgi:hypothetical protein